MKINSLTQNDRTIFSAILFLTIVSLGIRLTPALFSAAPLNDGGLFFSMVTDLIKSNLRLPVYASYNLSNIPFAYPPFALYLTAFFSILFKIDPLDIIRILPPVISSISIIIFYKLAKRLLDNETTAFLATMFYSFTPLAFEWQIMGGGITRSFGQLFALLTWVSIYDFYKVGHRKFIFQTIVFGAMVVLTHPEAALQTLIGVIVFWLLFSRRSTSFLGSVIAGITIFILTSPWWITILGRFGTTPFAAVFNASSQNNLPFLARIILLFQFNFTDEAFITLTAVFGMAGIFIAFRQNKKFIPIWLVTILLADPRSGARFAIMPLAMLAGLAIDKAILPSLGVIEDPMEPENNVERRLLGTRASRIFLGYLFIILVLGGFVTSNRIAQEKSITAAQMNALNWLRENTSSDSNIITLTGKQPLLDPLTEWAPALSERHVINSVFGFEWINQPNFATHLDGYNELQSCIGRDVLCLKTWMEEYGPIDYIIIQKTSSTDLFRNGLLESMEFPKRFSSVFDNTSVEILKYEE